MPLTAKQALFALEYLKDLNATQAAIRAGYAARGASTEGNRLLMNAEIQAEVAKLFEQRVARVQIDADDVLREVHAIATADANELVEYRRTCCRCCWGEQFQYQRTQQERARDLAAFTLREADLVDTFNELGGIGYDARKPPHTECPECFGEGVGNVFVKDTRKLSRVARALYAGAKVTKDGIEIKTHDKVKNLELLARHLGLLNDKIDVTVTDVATRIIGARKRAGTGE